MVSFTRKLSIFAEANPEQGIPDSEVVSRYIQDLCACLQNLILQIIYNKYILFQEEAICRLDLEHHLDLTLITRYYFAEDR